MTPTSWVGCPAPSQVPAPISPQLDANPSQSHEPSKDWCSFNHSSPARMARFVPSPRGVPLPKVPRPFGPPPGLPPRPSSAKVPGSSKGESKSLSQLLSAGTSSSSDSAGSSAGSIAWRVGSTRGSTSSGFTSSSGGGSSKTSCGTSITSTTITGTSCSRSTSHGIAIRTKNTSRCAAADSASHGARSIQSYRTSWKLASSSQGLGRVLSITSAPPSRTGSRPVMPQPPDPRGSIQDRALRGRPEECPLHGRTGPSGPPYGPWNAPLLGGFTSKPFPSPRAAGTGLASGLTTPLPLPGG